MPPDILLSDLLLNHDHVVDSIKTVVLIDILCTQKITVRISNVGYTNRIFKRQFPDVLIKEFAIVDIDLPVAWEDVVMDNQVDNSCNERYAKNT